MILDLYRQPEETTSTLAERYGVSNSTISRVLKQNLPADEYGQLIQQKRSGATAAAPASTAKAETAPEVKDPPKPKPTSKAEVLEVQPEAQLEAQSEIQPEEPAETSRPAAPVRRKRSQSNAVTEVEDDTTASKIPILANRSQLPEQETTPADASSDDADDDAIATAWDDDTAPLADADDDLDSDDDYGDDDDDDDDDDWTEETAKTSPRQGQLEILPFNPLAFQNTCYLVVDRVAELITCPLRDFAELGQIPKEEEQARTLPVFENHRVARRFSRRNQRVIKIPDGSIIQKTQPYLQAKGITRLLISGQVYTLS
jgi:hypothetical protein